MLIYDSQLLNTRFKLISTEANKLALKNVHLLQRSSIYSIKTDFYRNDLINTEIPLHTNTHFYFNSALPLNFNSTLLFFFKYAKHIHKAQNRTLKHDTQTGHKYF